MPTWCVTYTEHRLMEINVIADTEDEAKDMILDGDADYDNAEEINAEICEVTDVMEM